MLWPAALIIKTHYWLNKVSNGFSGFCRLLLGDRKIRLILKWGPVKWKVFFFMIIFVEQFQHFPCCLCMTILSLRHNKSAFFYKHVCFGPRYAALDPLTTSAAWCLYWMYYKVQLTGFVTDPSHYLGRVKVKQSCGRLENWVLWGNVIFNQVQLERNELFYLYHMEKHLF